MVRDDLICMVHIEFAEYTTVEGTRTGIAGVVKDMVNAEIMTNIIKAIMDCGRCQNPSSERTPLLPADSHAPIRLESPREQHINTGLVVKVFFWLEEISTYAR